MKRKFRIISFFGIVLFAVAAWAQNTTFTGAMVTDGILMGNSKTYRIDPLTPKGGELAKLTGTFDVVGTVDAKTMTVKVDSYKYSAFQVPTAKKSTGVPAKK